MYTALILGLWAAAGCNSLPQRPKFALPEDELLTTERIEALVPEGVPIEEARRVMELYGFRCAYGDTLGIQYLHCEQEKRKHLWPFSGVWSAIIYHNGYVQRVQGRYELAIVDHGTRIPRKTARVLPPPPGPEGPMVHEDGEPVIIEEMASKAGKSSAANNKRKPSAVKR
jgi:hypothetical protein